MPNSALRACIIRVVFSSGLRGAHAVIPRKLGMVRAVGFPDVKIQTQVSWKSQACILTVPVRQGDGRKALGRGEQPPSAPSVLEQDHTFHLFIVVT